MTSWEGISADLLLTDLQAFVRRFVSLSDAQVLAVALWVLHSHAFDAADTTPYLAVTSAEKRSGKTRLLEVLDLLVPRPWLTGRVTAAVLARKVDAAKPTLLLDESDAAFNSNAEYSEALRGILNTGFRRGGRTSVCVVRGGAISYVDLNTFCPKVIAGIGRLPDTVADRSIPIRLERKSRAEPVERFRHRLVAPEAASLADRAANWAEPNLDHLRTLHPLLPDELDDRAQDVWEPLLAIADVAGNDWPARAQAAALALSGRSRDDDESVATLLLSDIRLVFRELGSDRIKSGELTFQLGRLVDSPWGDWRGRTITPQAIATLLKPFGIRTREIWHAGRKERGYLRTQFEPIWARYLAEPVGPVDTPTDAPPDLPSHPAPTTPGAAQGGRRDPASETASTTPTGLWPPAEAPLCRYPSHRPTDYTADDGRRVCGTCHPRPNGS